MECTFPRARTVTAQKRFENDHLSRDTVRKIRGTYLNFGKKLIFSKQKFFRGVQKRDAENELK